MRLLRPARKQEWFATDYRRALCEYVEHQDEDHLKTARELGGLALRSGIKVFDVARVHRESWEHAMAFDGEGAGEEVARQARAAEIFLLDALAPFAVERRSLTEAYDRISELRTALVRRGESLAALAARQCQADVVLRATKARIAKMLRLMRSLKAEASRHALDKILVQEAERKRISRELHDELGQNLVAVSISLATLKKQVGDNPLLLEKVEAAQAVLGQGMESMHRIAQNLRAEILDQVGLREGIRQYLMCLSDQAGIEADLESGEELPYLETEQEIVLYRVAQESITNVVKHARATRVVVRFSVRPRAVCMEIEDNGCAFNVAEAFSGSESSRLGLLGMQERVRLARGDLSIESEPGHGTRVCVSIPYRTIRDGDRSRLVIVAAENT